MLLMARALLLILLQSALVACQIAIKISSEPPLKVNDEAKDTKYIVGTLPPGAHTPSHSRVLPMTNGNGTKYDCYLPGGGTEDDTTSIEVASRALFTQQTPEQLLDALTDWCAYRVEDWWSYEVCYKQHVRQFHKEHGKVVAEYVLGRYSEEESAMDSVQVDASDLSGKVKYVSQQYTQGDPCELNEQPRSTEVRYVCGSSSSPGRSSEHVITSIKEPASCSYLITISTPRLCKHPDFRDEPPPVASIRCIARSGSEAAAAGAAAADSGSTAGDGSTAAVSSPALPLGSASIAVGSQCSAEAAEGVCTPLGESSSGGGSSHSSASGQGSPGTSSTISSKGFAGRGGAGVAAQPSPAANMSTPAEEEWRDEEGYMIVEGEPDPQAEEEGEFDDQLADEMYDAALREAAELDGAEEGGGDEDALLQGREEL